MKSLEKYNELQGCREKCTIADLYTEVLNTLFEYSQSWTKVGQSKAWNSRAENESHSGPAYRCKRGQK